MAQLSAIAVFMAMLTASRFSTGNAPGRPRHTGQVLELGGSPKRVEQEQKILDCVRSWTCTSSPITASYGVRISTVALTDYNLASHSSVHPHSCQAECGRAEALHVLFEHPPSSTIPAVEEKDGGRNPG